ncbi:hypothetical protein NQ317_000346 [Molorchus minor]|uniref:Uncharacterized protein n=1 Tax=Molorchus minor TaxID=1323400 RepID=A0ABQ9JZL3_9CUCU|nr:hypothetical protein NQ317_000346 [Molorchus minor]
MASHRDLHPAQYRACVLFGYVHRVLGDFHRPGAFSHHE